MLARPPFATCPHALEKEPGEVRQDPEGRGLCSPPWEGGGAHPAELTFQHLGSNPDCSATYSLWFWTSELTSQRLSFSQNYYDHGGSCL